MISIMDITIFTDQGAIEMCAPSNIDIVATRLERVRAATNLAKCRYFNIRDLVWQVLIDCNVNSLPVITTDIAQRLGFALISYQDNPEFLAFLQSTAKAIIHTDAFCGYLGNEPFICYSNAINRHKKRFNISHEIGHLLLRHNPTVHIDLFEMEANMFAARLLMPAIVLKECAAFTPTDISLLCDVSLTAATFRSKRMHLLLARNKFYQSDVEKKLIKQFEKFVKSH